SVPRCNRWQHPKQWYPPRRTSSIDPLLICLSRNARTPCSRYPTGSARPQNGLVTGARVGWLAPTAKAAVRPTGRLPGSTSTTAGALVLAAIGDGPSPLQEPLRARDTELLATGLRNMGTHVSTMDEDRWVVRPRPLVGPAH